MRLGQDVLSDLTVALSREWVLGNGLGGSASGTCVGANACASHAHLVAASEHGRLTTLLLRFEERLHTDDGPVGLGTSLGPRSASRRGGHRLLDEFRLDPWPVWRFRADGMVLEKSLFMIYGHNAVVVSYRQLGGPPARLTISPLVAARDPHELQRQSDAMRGSAQGTPGRVRIETLPDRPSLTLWHSGAFLPARAWQRVYFRSDETEGEVESAEDAFVPGYVEATLESGGAFHLIASAEDDLMRTLAQEDRLGAPPPRTLAGCVDLLERDERERVALWGAGAIANAERTARQAAESRAGESVPAAVATTIGGDDAWIAPLAETLRLGLVRRRRRLTLVRSLPGAEEHGAETLRATAGLIALRGFETTREILRGYVEYLSEGLAPERFDWADGTPSYGDPAVSLWLVIAGERYARRSQDTEFAKHTLYPALESVMHFYRSGTTGGIHVDAEGLLAVGEEAGGSRSAGLNALWHHATVAMAQLARTAGRRENGAFYLAWANDHLKRFNEALWDESRGCLFASMDDERRTPGLDPSQLFAVSLAPPLLGGERAQRLVETVERTLLTPLGLRENAESAHASPLWLGAFCSALLRVHGRSPDSQARVRALYEDLSDRLGGSRLLPERFVWEPSSESETPATIDGDALSVLAAAELVRVWVEELDHQEAPAPLES